MSLGEYAITMERALLAVVIGLENIGEASALSPDDFIDPRHQAIFEVARQVAAASAEFHTFEVWDEIVRLGRSVEAGGLDYFATIVSDPGADPRLVARYVRRISEHAARRRLDALLDDLGRRLLNPKDSLEFVLDELREAIAGTARYSSALAEFVPIGARADDLLAEFASGADPGLPTMLEPLDDALLGGLKPGQLLVIAGATGMGKTALATQIALGAARYGTPQERGGAVLIYSFEMLTRELLMRFISHLADLSDTYRPPRGWTPADLPRAEAALREIAQLPIIVFDRMTPTVEAIRASVERYKAREGVPSLVVVDHIHLLAEPQFSNATLALAHVTRSLKGMAQELGMPVLALSQLNRELSRRDDHRPTLSDLRQSGSIEQDADVVMFVHRESYRDEARRAATEGAGVVPAEIIIAKHRAGLTCTVNVGWLGRRMKFMFEPGAEACATSSAAGATTATGTAAPGPSLVERIIEVVRTHAGPEPVTRATFFAAFGLPGRVRWGDWNVSKSIDQLVRDRRLIVDRDGEGRTAAYRYRLAAPTSAGPALKVISGGVATGEAETPDDDLDLEELFG